MRPHDLVFTLTGSGFATYEQRIQPLPSPYHERWVIVPRRAGFYWTVRRWMPESLTHRCTAQDYQELDCFILTSYCGSLLDVVKIEPRQDRNELAIVLAGDVLIALHALRWGNSHIHKYDWRLTAGGDRWVVEARLSGESRWTALQQIAELVDEVCEQSAAPKQ